MNTKPIIDIIIDGIGRNITIDDYPDILLYVNSCINTLQQVGVGNQDFSIVTKEETIDQFISDTKFAGKVLEHLLLSAKLRFDPPGTSYLIELQKEIIKESEYRLMINYDKSYTPNAQVTTIDEVI